MKLNIDIGKLKLKNPLIGASGTYGFGEEYSKYINLNKIAGISGKGITREPRLGNPPPRIAETSSGILNSVGLQNPGLEYYINYEIPYMRQFDMKIIANVAGNSIEDYVYMVERLNEEDIDAVELNVSCPNVKEGCLAFGSVPSSMKILLKEVRAKSDKPLIVKLTPNVTDIVEIALVCQDEGADAVSLINTLLGMAIDINTKRPILKNNYGGLSGPCVKPIALRMVNQVSNVLDIPVIGMGGISNYVDVIEFLMAGASAVMVGTMNFTYPDLMERILEDLEKYMQENKIEDIKELIGSLKLY